MCYIENILNIGAFLGNYKNILLLEHVNCFFIITMGLG